MEEAQVVLCVCCGVYPEATEDTVYSKFIDPSRLTKAQNSTHIGENMRVWVLSI